MILWVERRSGDDRYYLALSRLVSREEFLHAAKVVPTTYAGRMMDRMYTGIFENSLDVKRDFERYYKVEYGDFVKYCRRRLRLRADEAQALARVYDGSVALFEYKPGFYFLEGDVGQELLKALGFPGEE